MEAAFFDLDKTVIAKASMVAFGRPLYDAGMISRSLIVRAMWSNLIFHYLGADEERMRKFQQSALRITRGWDQALISGIVRDKLHEVIEPIVYAEALDLIREHQAAGRRVFIISASPEEIVAPLGQYLGVDEAIASRAELDEDGRYTGEVEFWSYGPFKAEAMREAAERYGIDLNASYAYSDSMTDVPMLETVGQHVAVNPDRELARLAREREWEVRWFQHGVPLRERVNMPPPGKTAVAVSIVAAISASGMLGWWWWSKNRQALQPDTAKSLALRTGELIQSARQAGRTRAQGGQPQSPVAASTRGRLGVQADRMRVRRPAASSRRKQPEQGRRESRVPSSWRAV